MSQELEFFPKHLQHRSKQRLTKIHQYLIRMRKLKLKAKPKLVTINPKVGIYFALVGGVCVYPTVVNYVVDGLCVLSVPVVDVDEEVTMYQVASNRVAVVDGCWVNNPILLVVLVFLVLVFAVLVLFALVLALVFSCEF